MNDTQKEDLELAKKRATQYTKRTARQACVVHYAYGYDYVDKDEYFKTYRKRKIYYTTAKPNLRRKIGKKDMKLVDKFLEEYGKI